MESRNGYIPDLDDFLDGRESEMLEANRLGLVSDGGGWGTGYHLTTTGEQILAARRHQKRQAD